MSRTVTISRNFVRLAAIAQIVLGVLFWTGNADGLVNIHMLVGILLVVALETIVVAAARAGVERRLVVLAGLWGLLVVILGLSQESLVTGSAHWVVEVLHLLVGLTAIGMAEALSTRIQQRRGGAVSGEPSLT